MFRTHVFFLLLSCSIASYAQIPGYIGKRLGAGIQESFFITPLLAWGEGHPHGKVIPGNKHCVFLDLTIGRKINLDIQYSLFRNKIFLPQSTYSGPSNVNASNITFSCTDSMPRVMMHFIDIGFSIFRKRFIAPMGPFHQFRIGYLFGELQGGNQRAGRATYVNSMGFQVYNPDAVIYGRDTYSAIRLGYAYGARMLIKNLFYFKYLFSAHLFIGEPFEWIRGEYINDGRDYIGSYLGHWTRVLNRFEINIGFGKLLF